MILPVSSPGLYRGRIRYDQSTDVCQALTVDSMLSRPTLEHINDTPESCWLPHLLEERGQRHIVETPRSRFTYCFLSWWLAVGNELGELLV